MKQLTEGFNAYQYLLGAGGGGMDKKELPVVMIELPHWLTMLHGMTVVMPPPSSSIYYSSYKL